MSSAVHSRLSAALRSRLAYVLANLISVTMVGGTTIRFVYATCFRKPAKVGCNKPGGFSGCILTANKNKCNLPAGGKASYPTDATISCVGTPNSKNSCRNGTANQLAACYFIYTKCKKVVLTNPVRTVCRGSGVGQPKNTVIKVRKDCGAG